MQNKRLLIVSYHFAPQNAIGAVRMTKVAKYLTRMGYDVTVLCGACTEAVQDPTLARDLEELKDVRWIREWNPLQRRREKTRHEKVKTVLQAKEVAVSGNDKASHAPTKRWIDRKSVV